MATRLTAWLERTSPAVLATFAIATAFSAYFCMYAVRKPFGAAHFPGEIANIDLKIAFVISQICGYALSKFIGIRFVSELPRGRRAVALIAVLGLAELALVGFALAPPGGKVVAMFLNGLPLGTVWGLVFSFLEGRRNSEILGAGLSCSYIVASGAVKSVGKSLMESGVPEYWMPAATGALFLPAFIVSVLLLAQLPAPNREDELARTVRVSMNAHQRREFFFAFAPGLLALTILYIPLTAYRDFRDNFAAEIFSALGETSAEVFTTTELWIAPAVLAALAMIYRISSNRAAFFVLHALMGIGSGIIGLATLAFELGWISGLTWMISTGLGLYLAYVPYGCVLFDRLIAVSKMAATAVFMIYVTDSFGYLGSIAVLLFKNFGTHDLTWIEFFKAFSYATSLFCLACFLVSAAYFGAKTRPSRLTADSK